MKTHLVWLRADLRIHDNPALYAACRDPNASVLAVYIATPGQWQQHDMAPRQAGFLHNNLVVLRRSLAQRGIPMHYHQCADFQESVSWLVDFCRRRRVDALFYNYQYELNERRRDAALERELAGGVVCQGFDDGVLLPPGTVQTGGGMYKVFTPFRNAFLRRLIDADPQCVPVPVLREGTLPDITGDLATFDYPTQAPGDDYPAGEAAALSRLRTFCHQQMQDYRTARDLPALDGTSRLSAYLAIGVISPRQCYNRLRQAYPEVLASPDSGAFTWLNELIWRDFYRHLIVAFPALCQRQPFIHWTRHVAWRRDAEQLNAWQRGQTGYPIIDAAMRQLNHSGWMHNRLRMITASFLVKDLLIDWREGERYFMARLIDGDFAANNGGWQWAASTGTDAAPYFRIFNPTTQGRRFDPQGAFIRHWLPELSAVPDAYVHEPHLWPDKCHDGLDYPLPIVDHGSARQSTLAAYKAAKALG